MAFDEMQGDGPPGEVRESYATLARWLADTNASAFGSDGASYEGWLRVARGGWAPSMVVTDGVMASGVDAL